MKPEENLPEYLQGLNERQLQAVRHSPSVPLQILAGPGSGKTRVLTSRVAYFITERGHDPASICAVTFTNKAANEMRERLTKMLGEEVARKIKVGTFHKLSAMYLRKNGKIVGIDERFAICDTEDSKKIMAGILKKRHMLSEEKVTLKELEILSIISKAKAKGLTADDVLDQIRDNRKSSSSQKSAPKSEDGIGLALAQIYKEYERALRLANSVDFDDLLLLGVKLFKHPKVVKWCKHVLVDEFQDSNSMQYEWMRLLAAGNRCVTIVGDPDQSIYGWRSADVKNLTKMCEEFPNTQQIFLERNYRSTGAILAASVAIVSQDKTRVQKSLHTTRAAGPLPVLERFESEYAEAGFIANEIKRLVAYTGGMLRWGDFAILLRFTSLSRVFESALQKQGIPNRVLAGHKFFERSEVKDLLAYLQLIDNPAFVPGFTRAINVPTRGIGDKTVAEILAVSERQKIAPLDLIGNIYDGHTPDIKPPVRRKIKSFVESIRNLRKLAANGTKPSDLLRTLVDSIQYQEHLSKSGPDWENRWGNVQELITFAVDVETSPNFQNQGVSEDLEAHWADAGEEFGTHDLADNGITEIRTREAKGKQRAIQERETPLRSFLQASMLSTDTTESRTDDSNSDGKVTISTCHAAKGLEWPVVFIPAVEKGTFPSSRADDIEEERRLLYVATTRAQGLLYLSHSRSRRIAGELKDCQLSEFVSTIDCSDLFANQSPHLSNADRKLLAEIWGRTLCDEEELSQRTTDYEESASQTSEKDKSRQQPSVAKFASARSALEHRSTKPTFASVPSASRALSHSGPPIQQVGHSTFSSSRSRSPLPSNDPKTLTFRSPQVKSAPGVPHRTPLNPLTTYPHAQSIGSPTPLSSSVPSNRGSQGAPQGTINSQSPTASEMNASTGKRRLGMGRTAGGYSNKKFKKPA